MGSWGCPHESEGRCRRVANRDCDPGMKGCVLHGKVAFSNPTKNSPRIRSRHGVREDPPTEARRDARGRRR
ncbi:hypothetical protein AN478_11240 [Thiohalorhabdus denitrificans]|uniref:Uncharacterized protein n=1 Tax=Thiohalorhabdus denitrificans TaxID=381306 RepID=A0A0P9EMH8_9GAMM|nr:hypothetical protein AN478_11240 [Thiohalorhabdus denitrificans]SCX94207.1 hypothetical protein SAMN05661077_0785 [Thiohalorhabdus denitrificans]